MSLRLYYHPLSSYCWKALIALYEADAHFEPVMINLGDPEERARLAALWPVTKFPVLEETASGQVWPEASILIERLAQIAPAARGLVPVDPDAALKVRLCDRIFDLHVQDHMQRIVADRLRPAEAKDPTGVAAARAAVAVTYDMLERDVPEIGWFCGEDFTLADCAAAPALYYANEIAPLFEHHPRLEAYLERLKARPSFARVLEEAEPYFHLFPRS